jgi:beta-glucosidase
VADNARLVEDVLRREWGFSGLVMSDWMGTYSTAEGLDAGVDLEMPGPSKWRGEKLIRAIEQGLITEDTIDRSARRVLSLAKRLGRFDSPSEPEERAVENPHRDQFISDAAVEGMVLLKNQDGVLLLRRDTTVAVIGHLARVVSLGGGGSARVDALHVVTLLNSLQELGVKHTYAPGVPVFGALPHADPGIVSRTPGLTNPGKDAGQVTLQWFNGPTVGKT